MPACVAASTCTSASSPPPAPVSTSPSMSDANGSVFFHSGWPAAEQFHPIEGERELRVDGLLDPERPVVVEGGDALRRGYEVWCAGLGHARHEGDDGALRRAVVPRRQWILRRRRRRRDDQP